MAFLLVVIGTIIVLIVLGLVLLPSFIDEAQIIALAQEQVRKTTGGELTVEGDIELALLPTVILVLGDTTIDLPPQGDDSGRVLASVGTLDIGISPLSLLTGDTEVGQVTLRNTRVQLFDVNGALATQLTLPELVANGLNTANSPMGLQAQLEMANLDGGQPIVVNMSGDIRIPKALDRINLDRLQTDISGVLSAAVNTTLSGTVMLSPLKATLALSADLPGGSIEGDLLYASQESPQIDLSFSTKGLDLDQWMPAQQAATENSVESSAEASTQPKAPPVIVPVGPLRDIDMRLAVTADSLTSNGQTITSAQLLMRVVNGVSNLNYLRGVLHKGQLDTTMTIDVRKPAMEVSLSGGLKGVDMNSLLSSLASPDVAQGVVNLTWDIDTQGVTDEDLKLGLAGDVSLTSENVEVLIVSAQAEMCRGIALINQESLTAQLPTTTKVTALASTVVFDDGQAQLRDLDVSTPGIQMRGRGAAALRDLVFQATIDTQVGAELEKLDNACRVDERYVGVEWPVVCTGHLMGEPTDWCRLDTSSIIEQMLKNEAKSKLRREVDKLGLDAGSALKKLFGK